VLQSAARLQELVPDAVVVGGTAAAWHARHRLSLDHDHVVADLSDRFDQVLEAIEQDPEFVFNRATPGKIILGNLGDIEVGVRQLIRARPLETEAVDVGDGLTVRVPTEAEMLRVKAYLMLKRNQVRDYLDVAALSDHLGLEVAAGILAGIDSYYAADENRGVAVRSQVIRQLGDPRPKDTRTLRELPRYKELVPRWQQWESVVAQCRALSVAMVEIDGKGDDS